MSIFRRGHPQDAESEAVDLARGGPATEFSFDALLPAQGSPGPGKGVDVPLELDVSVSEPTTPADVDLDMDAPQSIRAPVSPPATGVAGLPRPRGAYPHSRRAGPFLFVSGIGARQPDNSIRGARADAMGTTSLDIREQTRAVIENVRSVLRSAGLDLADLVEITTFLVHMNDFGGYNEVYGEYFAADGPARTTVAVHQLPHPHMLIEMKAVAYRP